MSIKNILFSILAVVLVVGCSETDSEKVEFTFIPDNPQVRFVDGKVQTGVDTTTGVITYTDIPAPWFKFRATVKNGSAKNLIVDSLKLTLTGLSSGAGTVTVTTELSASSYIGMAAVQPAVADVPAGAQEETVDFYVSGLSDAITSGVYNVEVLAEGWFGTIDDPGAKYSQKYFFTTD